MGRPRIVRSAEKQAALKGRRELNHERARARRAHPVPGIRKPGAATTADRGRA